MASPSRPGIFTADVVAQGYMVPDVEEGYGRNDVMGVVNQQGEPSYHVRKSIEGVAIRETF